MCMAPHRLTLYWPSQIIVIPTSILEAFEYNKNEIIVSGKYNELL